jgi:hypothetical protein
LENAVGSEADSRGFDSTGAITLSAWLTIIAIVMIALFNLQLSFSPVDERDLIELFIGILFGACDQTMQYDFLNFFLFSNFPLFF